MRGGDRYPVLVRKTETKPIRIYMQGGSNDQWLGGPELGDWWMANQCMQRALRFAGYEVEHAWGEGAHDMQDATIVFPAAMRWLWQDWPRRIEAGKSLNTFLRSILRGGEAWHVVDGYRSGAGLAANPDGEIVFQDVTGVASVRKIRLDGAIEQYAAITRPFSGIAFDRDGRCYVIDLPSMSIIKYETSGESATVLTDVRGNSLAVTDRGTLYVAECGARDDGTLWLVHPSGARSMVDASVKNPTAIALSPDGLWLAVAESATHWGYSYRVRPDGMLDCKQQFYWFHVPDDADDSGVGAWTMDTEGRLYAATRLGVQVFDRNGRVRAILPLPGGQATSLSFGGRDFDTLYVRCADQRIYRRKLLARGVVPGAAPIQLPECAPG